ILSTNVIAAVVRANALRYSGPIGVQGLRPVVDGNTLYQGGGLGVFCSAVDTGDGPGDDVPGDCTAASASYNRLADVHSFGVSASATAPGFAVRGNVLVRTAG